MLSASTAAIPRGRFASDARVSASCSRRYVPVEVASPGLTPASAAAGEEHAQTAATAIAAHRGARLVMKERVTS